MEWHRIKTVVIVILLVLNGFLLVLVGTQQGESMHYDQAALVGTLQVLEQNGIALESHLISDHTGRQTGSAQRSLLLEEQMVSALLGESVKGVDRGGGLYTYSADRGQISIRAGGELTAQLNDHPAWITPDPETHARSVMESLGVECRRTVYDVLGGNGVITYQQLLEEAPLFSCQLSFAYEDGRLTQLSGSLLAMENAVLETDEVLSLPTMLMRFLDGVLNSGDVCSAILSVEPGYLVTQSFTSTVGLRPVWYISTNTADYYVDGISGELSRAAE